MYLKILQTQILLFFSSLPKAKNTSLYSLRILRNHLKQLIARVKKVKHDIRNTLFFSNKKTLENICPSVQTMQWNDLVKRLKYAIQFESTCIGSCILNPRLRLVIKIQYSSCKRQKKKSLKIFYSNKLATFALKPFSKVLDLSRR